MCCISEIGAMKSLVTLNVSKNRLTQIPLALAASTSIMELFLNDNYLVEIPAKIMAMENLKVFEADRCSLQYLPGMIGPNVTHIRVFNNTRLTHYPTIYEKFLRLHYDYWSENVVRYKHQHAIPIVCHLKRIPIDFHWFFPSLPITL